MDHRNSTRTRLLGALIVAVTLTGIPLTNAAATPQPAPALPVIPAELQPADPDANAAPAPVTPDISYTTSVGSRVEMFTGVGNLDNDTDWRLVNEFAYLINSVPKYATIRASIYNAYWDGRHATADAAGKWGIYDSADAPESTVFGVTQAFRNQLNQYATPEEAARYVQTIGNRYTIEDALKNGSSLADLLTKAGVMKLCPNKGACLSKVTDALFHSKFALLSKAKDSTGKVWDNVIWITSANLNGASGGKKSNTGIAIFGDATGYTNLINNVWNPTSNMAVTPGYTAAATNGLGSSSSDFLFIPSPRSVDFEARYLESQTNKVLGGSKKSGCKVYVVHSLFSMARKAVTNALVALQNDGCTVKVVVGPPTVQEVTDTYFSMSEQLRKLISNFQFANVHDKTISVSYTRDSKKSAVTFLGSANLNGTSLSGDELAVRVSNATLTSASELHSEYLYKLAKLGTNIIPVVSIQLSPTDPTVMEGSSTTLKATVLPTNASQKAVSWKSSDPSVATVDSSGTVTGVRVGTAKITVTSIQGGKTASTNVTVTPAAAKYTDFDADGKLDTTILHRGSAGSPGSIEVRYGNGSAATLTPGELGAAEASTVRYTSSVVKDVNSDGYADLVVGAPALNGTTGTGTGRVYILYGSANGLSGDGMQMITSPVTPTADATGDQRGSFGSAVGVVNLPLPTLVIGEPYAKTANSSGGLVHLVTLDSSGKPTTTKTIGQHSAGVPGADESADGLGAAIAASGNVAMVGIPGEDIGTSPDAGSVLLFRFSTNGSYTATGYTQNSTGVPGSVEKGDKFGSVLALDGKSGVIGIPNEAIGTAKDAGSIQPFEIGATSVKWLPDRFQNSTGVPDTSEAGDRFGAQVAVVRQCSGQYSFAAGVPGEDLGSVKDQGLVVVLPKSVSSTCPIRTLTAGSSPLGGTASQGQGTPVSLAVQRWPGASLDTLLVGTQSGGTVSIARLAAPFTSVAGRLTTATNTSVPGPIQ